MKSCGERAVSAKVESGSTRKSRHTEGRDKWRRRNASAEGKRKGTAIDKTAPGNRKRKPECGGSKPKGGGTRVQEQKEAKAGRQQNAKTAAWKRLEY